VDFNGARSGVELQRRLYGDDRVQETVLTALAEAGDGVITTVSQTAAAPLQDKFCADRLRQIAGRRCGWYEASDAYVPAGNPLARAREQAPAEIARALGIDYRSVEVAWSEDHFTVRHTDPAHRVADDQPVDLRDWHPSGILWPYAWDPRVLGLPTSALVCNPTPYAIATTNKLLASILIKGSSTAPPTLPAGFWADPSGHLTTLIEQFSPTSALTVIKPAVGRRSFGVVLIPTDRLTGMAADLGLVANPDKIRKSAELTVIGLLWGQATDLLALAQPYVRPIQLQNPETGHWHRVTARATVIVTNDHVQCIDACALLAPQPTTGGSVTRDMLMVRGGNRAIVTHLPDKHYQAVTGTAESFVMQMERAVYRDLCHQNTADLVRAEAQLVVDVLQATTDGPLRQMWEAHQETITGYEALPNPD
jgi:hypothetical protein